jgi:hypothetical protein
MTFARRWPSGPWLAASLALRVAITLALPALPLAAQAGTAPARRAAAHAAPRTTPVTHARVPADTSAGARVRSTPRTLDEIHIEGEIPVPQVLFITARDQRRFMEFQHHRYQRTSLELGRATPTPSRVVVTAPAPAERKEIQR